MQKAKATNCRRTPYKMGTSGDIIYRSRLFRRHHDPVTALRSQSRSSPIAFEIPEAPAKTSAGSSTHPLVTSSRTVVRRSSPAAEMGRTHFGRSALPAPAAGDREEVWQCVKSGEQPHFFGVEPPRPRVETISAVDMSASNNWAELSAVFRRRRPATQEHEGAKADLKNWCGECQGGVRSWRPSQALEIRRHQLRSDGLGGRRCTAPVKPWVRLSQPRPSASSIQKRSLTAIAFHCHSPGNGTNPLNYTSRLR